MLWNGLTGIGGGGVSDLDIQSFFDSMDREHLGAFLDQRVRDGVIRRVLGKGMQAGVMEEGVVSYPERGSPQGGVISPLLSNRYRHEVLDRWVEREVRPRLRGRALRVRCADDALLAVAREDDARRVMAVLPKRFARFGLTLHPDKTRLLDFRRPSRRGMRNGSHRERSFDLLGFTHYWGRSENGNWVIKRKTATSRFSRAVRQIGQWCRRHRHLPVAEQHRARGRTLRGHDASYGITGNVRAVSRLRFEVQRRWYQGRHRRSHARCLGWPAFNRLLQRSPLPPARVVHSIYAT